VGITENSNRWIVCFEVVEVAVNIGVAEVVVEDDYGEVNVL
jgi:hypothetical protein